MIKQVSQVPSFNGDSDPNVYLEWETKVDHYFHVYKVQDDDKLRLVSLSFFGYAKEWWHKIVMGIIYRKKPPVVSRNALKECMHARFVPPSRKEHLLKFQRLPQGHRMVDEYFKDFETTFTKMNMHANEESKIKWFVRGLRRDIREFVELNVYSSLKKVFRIAIKVETYLLKTTFKNTHDDGFYNSSRKDANKISTQTKQTTSPKKMSTPKSRTKTSNIKCFKCLGFGHIALHCPQKQTLMINKVKQDLTHPPITSKNEKDREGQVDMGLILSHPRCFPSLSFSLPKVLTSPPSWLKNVRDDFVIPPNGFHHLRGLFPKHIITPKQIFPTWSVHRISFFELPLLPTFKSCLPFYSTFNCKNKLTLLYAGIQNSWTNSLQLEEYDENQIKEAFINEGRGHSPTHLKFFLLVFSKDEAQAQEGQSPKSPSPRLKPKPKVGSYALLLDSSVSSSFFRCISILKLFNRCICFLVQFNRFNWQEMGLPCEFGVWCKFW